MLSYYLLIIVMYIDCLSSSAAIFEHDIYIWYIYILYIYDMIYIYLESSAFCFKVHAFTLFCFHTIYLKSLALNSVIHCYHVIFFMRVWQQQINDKLKIWDVALSRTRCVYAKIRLTCTTGYFQLRYIGKYAWLKRKEDLQH